ncbi:penicillin-binding transpeptidase domain-containing protein [Acidiferrobacter sp.]|uniref:peptidoglycan D,D-transpeptidase FtsI family protein n=1 Tax=Acidiferrobacter sp. TaxID=1872107 RepID=UPI00261CB6D5|nr:penicillin-binding transpeptidase domain-containing protein [Acidiferrobacter sp.]
MTGPGHYFIVTGQTGFGRSAFVMTLMLLSLALMAVRAFYLQVLDAPFLRHAARREAIETVQQEGHRGMIVDRHGQPLAISTPVDSLWANPRILLKEPAVWPRLTRAIGWRTATFEKALDAQRHEQFMYLRREVDPRYAQRVLALRIPGVASQREYRRYYPAGAVAATLIGFTNINDQGQDGVELAYNSFLSPRRGRAIVVRDGLGGPIAVRRGREPPRPGHTLVLSIDERIQYLAYRELLKAVRYHDASSGSVIVLDARTGEVLALANVPSFNPNTRSDLDSSYYRDRAVTDVLEPGSSLKPFTIALALQSGRIVPHTLISTSPGSYWVGPDKISDVGNFGLIDVSHVIAESSNVGASKIALTTLTRRAMYRNFLRLGFAHSTHSGLPGESSGFLSPPDTWEPIQKATLSFGYGISVTPMQMARAYTVFADGGILRPISILKAPPQSPGRRVFSRTVVSEMRHMLELAASPVGTGANADVVNYRVAGKTGTAHIADTKGYHRHRYVASFGGFAPASDPRLVIFVDVRDPRKHGYYGAQCAAPVFRKVMTGALRILNIPPDNPVTTMARAHTRWS